MQGLVSVSVDLHSAGVCNSPKASAASMKNINPLFVHSSVECQVVLRLAFFGLFKSLFLATFMAFFGETFHHFWPSLCFACGLLLAFFWQSLALSL
jgi:hypothetical protein